MEKFTDKNASVSGSDNVTPEASMRELAERIYDLDAEVYVSLGSSLGRVFHRDREACVREVLQLMKSRKDGHIVRSTLALIGNMARTVEDKEERRLIMKEYNALYQALSQLPTSFAEGDLLSETAAKTNSLALQDRFAQGAHKIICISRTYGSGGSEIGFQLAEALKINYYDAEIFRAVLERLEATKDEKIADTAGHPGMARDEKSSAGHSALAGQGGTEDGYLSVLSEEQHHRSLLQWLRDFNRYHGLSRRDAVFFNQSDLICEIAQKEDFVIMGRCADQILTNHRIPHVNIFITAPMEERIRHVMDVKKDMNARQCEALIKKLDRQHSSYFRFFTGKRWGSIGAYDLCINSASYGIEGSVGMILKML